MLTVLTVIESVFGSPQPGTVGAQVALLGLVFRDMIYASSSHEAARHIRPIRPSRCPPESRPPRSCDKFISGFVRWRNVLHRLTEQGAVECFDCCTVQYDDWRSVRKAVLYYCGRGGLRAGGSGALPVTAPRHRFSTTRVLSTKTTRPFVFELSSL